MHVRQIPNLIAMSFVFTACGASPLGAPGENTPPTISGTPLTTTTVGLAYAFAPVATDADGDSLTFSVANPPPWLSFDNATGRLSGTATVADLYPDVQISVTDGLATTSLAAFSITSQAAGPASFPDASSTGITAAECPNWAGIKTDTGGRTITTDGAVIENEEVAGQLTIRADNVTLRCLNIDAGTGSLYGINCVGGTNRCNGLLVENVEVADCNSACVTARASETNPAVFRRLHLHNSAGDLMKIDGNVTLEHSYLHGFSPASSAHNDALQTSGPAENIVLRGNRIEGPYQAQTSAWILKPDFGLIDAVLIENNFFSGGAYTLYLRDSSSFPQPTNVIIRNNVWASDSWQFGPLSSDMTVADCLEWYGNTFDDESDYPASANASPPGTCTP